MKDLKRKKILICIFIIGIIICILMLGISILRINQRLEEETRTRKTTAMNMTELRNPKEVSMEENKYITVSEARQLIQQETVEAKTKIDALYQMDYKIPTIINGVVVNAGGYAKVGNMVIVNIKAAIDTSKLNLTSDANKQTLILKDFPDPINKSTPMAVYYVTGSKVAGQSYNTQYIYATMRENGELVISQNADYPYTSGYALSIIGAYLMK